MINSVHNIYKIVNSINDKIYVGQTTRNIRERFYEHKKTSNPCVFLKQAMQKYGKDKFSISLIETVSSIEEANERESYWISLYNSTNGNYGYNFCSGGQGNPSPCSPKTKEKLSIAMLGNKNPNFGTKKSAEWKSIISAANKGKKLSEERKKKLSEMNTGFLNPNFGLKRSSETKAKMSASQKGKPRFHKTTAKPVMEITTGKQFESSKAAAEFFKINFRGISKNLNGQSSHYFGLKFRPLEKMCK